MVRRNGPLATVGGSAAGAASAAVSCRAGWSLLPRRCTGALRSRGGCWFRALGDGDLVTAEIHFGVEEPFVPARKAHPALLVGDLEQVASRLEAAGFEIDWSQRASFAPYVRFHTFDTHGNRVEVLAERP